VSARALSSPARTESAWARIAAALARRSSAALSRESARDCTESASSALSRVRSESGTGWPALVRSSAAFRAALRLSSSALTLSARAMVSRPARFVLSSMPSMRDRS
jgi:mevalonate pyrophosphate decarboxylase